MANTCDTTYKVTGTRKAVTDLWTALQKLGAENKKMWLDELAEYYGIDYEQKCISVRGHIYFMDFEDDEQNDVCLLTFETETAWSGCHDLFHEINHLLWDELSISYREVECGCGIFSIHDEGSYFPEECCVSSYGEPFEDVCEDSYDTIEDAINVWCEQMHEEQGERTKEQMMDYINEYEYENSDTYFYINPFVYE